MIGDANGRPGRATKGDINVSAMLIFFNLATKLLQYGRHFHFVFGTGGIEMDFLPFGQPKLDGFFAFRKFFIDVSVPCVETRRRQPAFPAVTLFMGFDLHLIPLKAAVDNVGVAAVLFQFRFATELFDCFEVQFGFFCVVKVHLLPFCQPESDNLGVIMSVMIVS